MCGVLGVSQVTSCHHCLHFPVIATEPCLLEKGQHSSKSRDDQALCIVSTFYNGWYCPRYKLSTEICADFWNLLPKKFAQMNRFNEVLNTPEKHVHHGLL